ncbi:tetratricopeptide repeat protein [Amphiplicatus metriothermophilus]|uniref:Pentatricopeptide repeat domain-containing protein (PPR motif) n=1 Tax=Amphiplicatus metriothermophilus TaxID=1519374 RepID=A0A239PJ48_9PROT|nr:tetratricopeptide repeat protein [Amphiplicatus metriothermophilus]MBB5517845.1 pentatricopeptide repeat protein [Amphiplicatus metriothermophilus]SNT67821.1 pentatricopeptide repeat domain-containing protein (PPR motif) [Amphiplicatus metriothermophilus]
MRTEARLKRGLRLAALTGVLLISATAACSSPEERLARYTQSGQEFLAEGDLGKANVQFQNALKINEDHVPALLGVAEIAERKQDFDNLFGILQRVVRLDPSQVEARVDLGKLYLVGGDETAAMEAADAAIALDPENAEAIALKAAVLLRLDDMAGATELARKALAIDPATPEAVAVIAAERAKSGDEEAALAEVEKGLAADANIPVLHLLRLQLLAKMERTEDLLQAHREVIALYPDNVAYRQLFVKTLLDEKKYALAKAQLEEIARLRPRNADAVLDVVRIENRLNGAEAAKEIFRRYIESRPDDLELQFRFGGFLRQQGDLAGAEAVFKALAARKGDAAVTLRARNEIAALRLLQGEKEEARAIIDEILATDDRNTEALLKRASLKIDAGEHDDAILDLRTALEDQPDSAQAKALMAAAFERKGDIEYAKSQLAQAVADSGNDPTITNAYAKLLMRANNVVLAERTLVESLEKHPSDLENLKLLAAVRLMRQDWRGAEETAKRIEEASAEDPVVNRIRAAAYAGLKDYAGVIDALGEENVRKSLSGRPLATLVGAYVQSGRSEEAIGMLRSMIESNADNYEARILLARTLATLDRRDEAEATLKEALARAPERAEAIELLYRLMVAGGRLDEAGAMLDAAIAAAPDNIGARIYKADYLLAGGRKEEALAMYADILERRPGDLLASNNYASLLGELRDDPESRAKALKAAEVLKGSENPYFLDTLGWAQHRAGDHESAIENLEKALAGSTGFGEAHYHLGAAYLAIGETEKARAELQKAVEAGGQGAWIEEARRLLAQN